MPPLGSLNGWQLVFWSCVYAVTLFLGKLAADVLYRRWPRASVVLTLAWVACALILWGPEPLVAGAPLTHPTPLYQETFP